MAREKKYDDDKKNELMGEKGPKNETRLVHAPACAGYNHLHPNHVYYNCNIFSQ